MVNRVKEDYYCFKHKNIAWAMSSSNETHKPGLTLCFSDFWNTEYTWYPENGPPDFTPCFHKTALVWVPCIQLWLTSIIEVQRAKSSNAGPIPWSLLNILKTMLLIMVLSTSTGQVWSLKWIFRLHWLRRSKNLNLVKQGIFNRGASI